MKKFWTTLSLSAILTTFQFVGFLNQRANEAQAHCRAWHPHHCTVPEVVEGVVGTVDRWGLAAVSPKLIPVSGYLEFLLQQGNGRWRKLPDDFKTCYREHYRFDLDDVRFATNVNTIHGQAITVDSQIYFPTDINLSDRSHRHWMLHELEHVRQYKVVGGVSAFLVKYVVQGGIEVGRNGSINIHDNIGLEREAESKADRILDACSSLPRLSGNGTSNPSYIIETPGQPAVAVFEGRRESFALGCPEIRDAWGVTDRRGVSGDEFQISLRDNPVVADLPCNGSIQHVALTDEGPQLLLVRHRDGNLYRHYINSIKFPNALRSGSIQINDGPTFRATFSRRGNDFQSLTP